MRVAVGAKQHGTNAGIFIGGGDERERGGAIRGEPQVAQRK